MLYAQQSVRVDMNLIVIAAVVAAVCLQVGGASSFGHLKYHPLGHPLDSRADAEVKASGLCYEVNKLICSKDCKQVFLCVKDENAWAPILIANCTTGMYCDGNRGICTTSLSTCSPTVPPVFQLHCTATGHFPDPYDCTVYHECSAIGVVSKVSACPAGWSYNALTTECDHRVSSGVCFPSGVIPPCTSPGQSGPVPENPNIYYVCLQTATGLLHELFKCNHGGHYNNGQCTENDLSTTEDATSTTTVAGPTTTVAASETTTIEPTTTPVSAAKPRAAA